jgi:hypothetical protein
MRSFGTHSVNLAQCVERRDPLDKLVNSMRVAENVPWKEKIAQAKKRLALARWQRKPLCVSYFELSFDELYDLPGIGNGELRIRT